MQALKTQQTRNCKPERVVSTRLLSPKSFVQAIASKYMYTIV